eukprot:COSAG01_NODE_76016_length_191_cov_1.086957_1_plen_33_part_01
MPPPRTATQYQHTPLSSSQRAELSLAAEHDAQA